jgi:hypothetical protein
METVKKYGFLVLVLLVVALRFSFPDQDLPSYRVINHMDTDQYYYTHGAVSFFHYNQFYTPFPPGKDYSRNLFDFFQNLWTAPFLKLFGNNLIAFKLATLVLSLWAIYLLYASLKLLKINKTLISFGTLFLLVEFMVFISSRVQNPTIYSFFACSMLLFLIVNYETSEKENRKKWYLFMAGLWAVWSVFMIYIFNMFLLGALGSAAFVYFIFIRKQTKYFFILCLGCIVGFVFYNGLTYLVYEKTVLDLLSGLKKFGGGDDFRSIKELEIPLRKKLIHTVAAFFTINYMRFNLFLFVIFTPAIVFFIMKVFKSAKSLLNLTLLFAIVFTFIQLWFEPNYSPKKLTSLLPVYVLIIIQAISLFGKIEISKKEKLVYGVLSGIGLLSAMYCYKITTADWYENLRAGSNTEPVLNYINISVAFVVMVLLVLYFLKIETRILKYGFMCLIFIPSLCFITRYILINRTYHFKNSLLQLSKISEGKNMAGDYPEALMLYNNFHAFRPYHVYKSSDEYLRLLESDSVQIVNFKTPESLIKGYDYFDDQKQVNKRVGDTLLNGSSYFVLVDQILDINQGKQVYIGVRRPKSKSTK